MDVGIIGIKKSNIDKEGLSTINMLWDNPKSLKRSGAYSLPQGALTKCSSTVHIEIASRRIFKNSA